MCVCARFVTDGPESKKQAERTEKVLLHEPGPHVAARGEFLLPDLHLFLEPSYIGMIANVQLISFKHSQTNSEIHEIEHRQHGDAQVEQGGKKS